VSAPPALALTETHLSGVALDETGVDSVSHGKAGEVGGELISLDLVGGKGRRELKGLVAVDLDESGLVRNDGQELVVNDLDLLDSEKVGEG
jgi:hypothetical protein